MRYTYDSSEKLRSAKQEEARAAAAAAASLSVVPLTLYYTCTAATRTNNDQEAKQTCDFSAARKAAPDLETESFVDGIEQACGEKKEKGVFAPERVGGYVLYHDLPHERPFSVHLKRVGAPDDAIFGYVSSKYLMEQRRQFRCTHPSGTCNF